VQNRLRKHNDTSENLFFNLHVIFSTHSVHVCVCVILFMKKKTYGIWT